MQYGTCKTQGISFKAMEAFCCQEVNYNMLGYSTSCFSQTKSPEKKRLSVSSKQAFL
jgi:hypothetical protein